MRYIEKYYHCGDYLQKSLEEPIKEIALCAENVQWSDEFHFITEEGEEVLHQIAYNKAFEKKFLSY